MMRAVLLIFIALVLSSCQTAANKQANCQSTDWYELGRRSGASGQPSQVQNEHRRCGQRFDLAQEAIYVNGYNNGLSEYCTADNGYALGKAGNTYARVCPRPTDQGFLAGYNRGQRVRELENVAENLDRQISSVNQKLKAAKEKGRTGEQGSLSSELSGLQQELQNNRKRLSQMEKQEN